MENDELLEWTIQANRLQKMLIINLFELWNHIYRARNKCGCFLATIFTFANGDEYDECWKCPT
jgi:hypothetical protein